MPDPCDPIRKEVSDLELQLAALDPTITDDPEVGVPRQHPRPNPEYRRVASQLSVAKARLRACEDPPGRRPPPSPVPLTLRAGGLRCFDQNDTNRGGIFDFEDDEPYILAFAVDVSLPAGFMNSKLTRIGPIEDVDEDGDEGVFFALPGNLIWGLSESPQIVSSADNFICIVALMENDDANPNQVRELAEIDLKARLAIELFPFAAGLIPREELVRRLINTMNGVLPIASVAFPGPDDQIGTALELRYTQFELDDIYRQSRSTIEKKLYFAGDDAKYDVFFTMSR